MAGGVAQMAGAVLLVAGTLLPGASGHGSLVVPPPRNSVDRSLPMWAGGKHPVRALHFTLSHSFFHTNLKSPCAEQGSSPNAPGMPTIEPFGCDCVNGTEPCESAQSVRCCSPPRSGGLPACACPAPRAASAVQPLWL